MCEDNAAMGGHQWRVIDFGYSSLIGVEKAGGFPHYLGLSKGIDGRPPNFEIEGRDDIYSLGQVHCHATLLSYGHLTHYLLLVFG